MKTLPVISLAILFQVMLSGGISNAQEYQPFSISTMAGVSGINFNPSSIADTRYKVDILLGGINLNAGSNYVGLNRDLLFQSSLWDDTESKDELIDYHYNGKDIFANLNMSISLPSFMISVGDYSAIGFSSGIRSIINADNLTEEMASLLTEGFDYEPTMHRNLTNPNLNFQVHSWAEYGLTFARVIPLILNKHFIKAGITLKYLQGIAAAYVYTPELRFIQNGRDSVSLLNSDVYYGIAGDIDNLKGLESISNPRFGLSFGFVYEFRPEIDNYTYESDDRKNLVRFDADKYLLRVGVSILDMGSIYYLKEFGSQDFRATTYDWKVNDIEANSLSEIGEIISEQFGLDPLKKEKFKMKLPSVLNVNIDLKMTESVYLNFNPVFRLMTVDKDNPSMAFYNNTYTFSARYDREYFGAALPVTFDESGRMKAGIALRLGPIWLGSNSLITTFTGSRVYNADFYAMAKIPIFRKKIGMTPTMENSESGTQTSFQN